MIHLPYIEDVAEFTHTKDPAKCSLLSQVLCTNGVCCTPRDFARGSNGGCCGSVVDPDWLNTNFPCMMVCPRTPMRVTLIAQGRFVTLATRIGNDSYGHTVDKSEFQVIIAYSSGIGSTVSRSGAGVCEELASRYVQLFCC
jgi:hypothetical protein